LNEIGQGAHFDADVTHEIVDVGEAGLYLGDLFVQRLDFGGLDELGASQKSLLALFQRQQMRLMRLVDFGSDQLGLGLYFADVLQRLLEAVLENVDELSGLGE